MHFVAVVDVVARFLFFWLFMVVVAVVVAAVVVAAVVVAAVASV